MANSRFYQFLYSKVPMLTMIQGSITFGASGAVSSASGAGVQGVTKLATGIYQIRMVDNFNALVDAHFLPEPTVTGNAITAGSFVASTLYQIVTVGNTNYSAVGLAAGLTAAVGQVFVATGVGSGTGTVKAIGYQDSDFIDIPLNGQVMLQSSLGGTQGACVIFRNYQTSAVSFTGDTHTNTTIDNVSSVAGLEVGQSIAGTGIALGTVITAISGTTLTVAPATTATAATVTMSAGPAKVLASPASGSVLQFSLFFRNSSNTY